MDIRPMMIEDYNATRDLWLNAEGIGLRSLDDSPQGIARFLMRNPNMSYVAQINGQIVGVILCGHDGRRGHIYHMAVDAGHHRKGIGKGLVNAALDALKKEHINKAALIVYTTNDLGNAFWKSAGFEKRDDLFYRDLNLNEQNG